MALCGWMGEDEEFQMTLGDLVHDYLITTDPPMGRREYTKLLENCFLRDMPKAFHDLQRFCTFSNAAVHDGIFE